MQRLTGLTDPAIAYDLLTTTKQLHASERKALEDMLVGDLGLAYLYAKANQLLGKWPLFDAAIKEAARTHARIEHTNLQSNEILDLYLYIQKVISGTP